VSRISRGKIELRRERIELAQVVAEAVESSRPLIEKQGHELKVTLPPQPIHVDADQTRLSQVFLNLLNNAAKFSERGGRIDLTAECRGNEVFVSVKDTGIGIPAANLNSVFEMFAQVEGTLSRSQGGLGIGLCLVKNLVEMHGGQIEVRSEGRGKGSEFLVRLPIVLEQASAPHASEPGDVAIPTSELRILVVDDNWDAASSLTMLLTSMGNTTFMAHDGEEAVAMAGRVNPDVVLLDIGLPKMNGYEAARAIRQKAKGDNMVLIAVTGWGQDDDKRKSEEAGFDRHMVKPVDPRSLMKMLAGLNVVRS
jgi:CheY-like chemotaxis protein